jgi:hypothetical protein
MKTSRKRGLKTQCKAWRAVVENFELSRHSIQPTAQLAPLFTLTDLSGTATYEA